MADFGLWKQAWMWLQSQKHILAWAHTAACGSRERLAFLVDQHWPAVSRACATFSRLALAALRQWRGCMARGVLAVASLGPAAVFVMLWSFFVCMTSPAWALYALLSLVLLVHPDKNMGNPLACESFKKLQSAYEASVLCSLAFHCLDYCSSCSASFSVSPTASEGNSCSYASNTQVLSDFTKRNIYDEQLRKEESQKMTPRSCVFSQQVSGVEFRTEESRRIQCTKCGNFHIWICTKRSKTKARFCQGCDQYHQAKDGDGWVETRFATSKMEIPRAFVCAESKIFDVSEWATCQGMECKPNTHGPTFMVNMVGADRMPQRSYSSRYPFSLDAEMIPEDEFELWLQQALASGVFADSPKRRKSWSPFKLPQKGMKSWRRSS
nr:unnamed protein product [Digitaria exilis]